MLANGLSIALALHLATIAVTLLLWRRRQAARLVAFLGAALASVVDRRDRRRRAARRRARAGRAPRPSGVAVRARLRRGRAERLVPRSSSRWWPRPSRSSASATSRIPRSSADRSSSGWRSTCSWSAIELVLAAGDAVTFLFAWELMTLATAALVATEHETRANRGAAYLYLVMSHVGTGCLIAGFFVLASATRSLSFSMLLSGSAVASGPVRDACSRSSSSASASRRASSRCTSGCPKRTPRRRPASPR